MCPHKVLDIHSMHKLNVCNRTASHVMVGGFENMLKFVDGEES